MKGSDDKIKRKILGISKDNIKQAWKMNKKMISSEEKQKKHF